MPNVYNEIINLILDCRECTKTECPEWCKEFVNLQVGKLSREIKSGEYVEKE